MDFPWIFMDFLWIFIDLYRSSLIFIDFQWFNDFHWLVRISLIFIEFLWFSDIFIDFHCFPCCSQIFNDFQWFSMILNDIQAPCAFSHLGLRMQNSTFSLEKQWKIELLSLLELPGASLDPAWASWVSLSLPENPWGPKSWFSMIFIDCQWFSLIFNDFMVSIDW